jgi:hypothetical protein
MFDPNNFDRVKKLSFKFKYIFKDEANKILKLIIADWEVGEVFLKYKKEF